MKHAVRWGIAALVIVAVPGCFNYHHGNGHSRVIPDIEILSDHQLITHKIDAVGRAAPDNSVKYEVQRMLLAMRASELDAYRLLAQRLESTQVDSTSTVEDLMRSSDRVSVAVSAFLKGAKIKSQRLNEAGFYETRLELDLDEYFYGLFHADYDAARPIQMINVVTHGASE